MFEFNNDFEDDWESAIIPDLLKEQKKIDEQKKVEEADAKLIKELFSKEKIDQTIDSKPVILKTSEKQMNLKNVRQKLIEHQKQKSEIIKKKKAEQMRSAVLYGLAELDEYDELYGSIQDKY